MPEVYTPASPAGQTRIQIAASSISEVMDIGCELALGREYVSYLRDIVSMLKEVRNLQRQSPVAAGMRRAG